MFPPGSADPSRILLVEDNAGDARLIEEMLAEAGSKLHLAAHARRLEEGIAALKEGSFAVALLDLTLPDSTGMNTFQKLHAEAPQLPIVVLSGRDDEAMAVQTVHEGAQDYLVKSKLDPGLLVRSILYAIERGRIEGALEQERELLTALLDHIPDSIFFKDLDSRFLRVNKALSDIFNLEQPGHAVGRSDYDFFPKDLAEELFAEEKRVIETGEPIIGKWEKTVLPDGTANWKLVTKLPLQDRQGRTIGTTGIARDVTALKRMEEALAAERNLLRSVIDNLPDPIYVKDAHGAYVLDNVAHMKFLGVREESEVIGKTVFDFFTGEVAQRFHEDDMMIIRTGEPLINREEIASSRSGLTSWLSTTKVPLRNEENAIIGLVCIGRDITQRKLAEEQLQLANQELSSALDRLKDAHKQLQSTQLQLIEAEKMKTIGRLAAGVAHEVKNPLAIITMGLEFLSQQEFPAESGVPQVLDDLADAVTRADAVIKGMLDYSAPKTLALDEENLNHIIEHALLLVRGEMDLKKHRIVKELPPDLPRVKLDRMKIGQVFVNVFTNALHAMPEGGTLSVRTYAKQLTGVGANIGDERSESFRVGQNVVVAEIEDSGHGIPPDKLTKVFDPFFTTKPTGKGTGLGLSVTRSIVDLHGGTITVGNRETGGAKVTLTLSA